MQNLGAHGTTYIQYGEEFEKVPDFVFIQSHNIDNSNQAVVSYNIIYIYKSSVQVAYVFSYSSAENISTFILADLILIWK